MINKVLKNNFFKCVFLSIMIILTIIYFYKRNIILNYAIQGINQFVVLAFALTIEIILFFIIDRYNKINKHKLYLLLIIPIGLMFMFLIPIGRVPDENAHLFRTYEVSMFHFKSELKDDKGGRDLPNGVSNLFDYEKDYIKYKDEMNDLKSTPDNLKSFAIFTNTSLYSFICYLPQSIGVFIGKNLNLNPLITAYLGRLTNFIIAVIIVTFAIKIFPGNKNILFFIALMPMFIQEMISLSPDALTNALSMLLISYILYLKNKDKIINKKELITIALICIILSQCKIVYLPLCLSVFILPAKLFKSNKDKYIKIGIIAVLTVTLNLIWLTISSKYLIEFNQGVNSGEQIKYVLSNPINYLLIIFRTIKNKILFYLKGIVGIELCYFDVVISKIFMIIFYPILLFNIIVNNYKLDKKNIFLLIFIIFSVIMLIFTSLYVQWTPLKNVVIDGVQGRYLIPILSYCSLFICLKNNKLNKYKNIFNYYAYFLIILINIIAINTIFISHI